MKVTDKLKRITYLLLRQQNLLMNAAKSHRCWPILPVMLVIVTVNHPP